MKLTVLGCWAPYPRKGGACPGYLVQEGDINLLIDCGNGVLSKLQEVIDFRQLSALIISHYHPDHYVDIYSLRHAIWGSLKDGSRKDKLKVYLPNEPKEVRDVIEKYTDVFDLQDINNLPSYSTNFGNLIISFMPTKHPLLTFATKIESGSSKIVYTADTQWDKRLVDFAKGADLLLCEASLQEKDQEATKIGHLTCRQAGQLALDASVEKLLLTHFWPEYDMNISKEEAKEIFKGWVEIAQEGQTITV